MVTLILQIYKLYLMILIVYFNLFRFFSILGIYSCLFACVDLLQVTNNTHVVS